MPGQSSPHLARTTTTTTTTTKKLTPISTSIYSYRQNNHRFVLSVTLSHKTTLLTKASVVLHLLLLILISEYSFLQELSNDMLSVSKV